jgi:hypothetical protein
MRQAMSAFAGPPYVVSFLPAGSYQVSVSLPGIGKSDLQTVQCTETAVTLARFSVP